MKRQVVIGFIGTQLDASGGGAGRWEKWRPTVSLGMHEDFAVDRMELLVDQRRFRRLSEQLVEDMQAVSPDTEVKVHDVHLADPWDFEQVYAALFDFVADYPFDTEHEDYLVHITTGTHVVQICWFLLAEARYLPGRLIQTSPPRKQKVGDPGSFAIIDLDLARYDRIAQRFAHVRAETAEFLKSGIETRSPAFNGTSTELLLAIRSPPESFNEALANRTSTS